MKRTIFFTSLLVLFVLAACRKRIPDPIELPDNTIPGFVTDHITLLDNDTINDSMLVDFDNDQINDLSIFAYWQDGGTQSQIYYYRLNSINNDYQILAEVVNDTICIDTVMFGNTIISAHVYNCNSPAGTIVSDTFAVSSDQSVVVPEGFYLKGITDIRREAKNSQLTFTNNTHLGNSQDGYFFIQHVTTDKIYAIKLRQTDPNTYRLEDAIKL